MTDKLRKKLKIPETWNIEKIGNVTESIFSGGTPNTRIPEYWNGDVSWLSSGETSHKFIRGTERKISELGVKNSSTKLAKIEDVVVASAGQGHTRGQTSFCMIDTYVNQSVVVLRSDDKNLKSLFLFYNLLLRYNELRTISDAQSSRGSLTTKILADMDIVLPSYDEQTLITQFLSNLDFKIELNQNMNKTIEEIGKTLFKHWFMDFEFPNEEGKPYKSSGGKMIYDDELKKDIPKGWKSEPIHTIVDLIKDQISPLSNPESKFWHYSIDAFDSKKNPPLQSGIEILSNKFVVHKKTILFSKLNPRIRRVWAVLNPKQNSICSTEFLVFKPKENLFSFFYYLLTNSFLQKELIEMVKGTTGSHQRISPQDILEKNIIIPDEKILLLFDNVFLNMFELQDSNIIQSISLSKIRNLLLPKFLSGKIRIPMRVK